MKYDVVIVGGGLVGASLAIALKESGLSLLVVEANSASVLQSDDFDARSLALSDASKTILSMLGIWDKLAQYATPIESIHVSKQAQFGRTLLHAKEHQKPAFGYVLEIAHLNQVLQPMLQQQENVEYWQNACLKTLRCHEEGVEIGVDIADTKHTVFASILVAADGTFSSVRALLDLPFQTKTYQSSAIVANIGLRRAHQYWAYERFTENGLIALLPMRKQRASLVWALADPDVDGVFNLPDDLFLETLQRAFGYRLGRFTQVGRRAKFPLKLSHMSQRTMDRVVFVGNAAQTLHPVAGQGFNLGLRDVAVLAEVLPVPTKLKEVVPILKKYEQLRQGERDKFMKSTDLLVEFFGMNHFVSKKMQSAGLVAIDNLAFVKQALVQGAMGYSALNSKLSCRIPLREAL